MELISRLRQDSISEKIAKIIIIVLIMAHFLILVVSPPGFYIDEAATGSHVVSMLDNQKNANGQQWPLFSKSLGGGYTTPTYLYPLVVWSAVFGDSEYSLRAFSQFVTILAIFILGISLRLWFDKKAVLITWLVGLTLPWAWLQGSLAWDPALIPLFVSLVFFGFTLIEKQSKHKFWGLLLITMSSAGMAYTYPPTRITAPVLFGASLIYLLYQHKINYKEFFSSIFFTIILVIPLALFMFQPDALVRSQQLSVFYNTSFINGIYLSIINFINLLNPYYLFIDSGENLRHGVGLQGMLGLSAFIATIIPLMSHRIRNNFIENKAYKKIVLIAFFGITTSYIGSALTTEGQPHYLRACAAWPFYVIIITIGWSSILALKSKIKYLYIASASFFTLLFMLNLIFIYPDRSREYFDFSKRSDFFSGQTDTYPDIIKQYYLRQ